jgi:hypothetical protein
MENCLAGGDIWEEIGSTSISTRVCTNDCPGVNPDCDESCSGWSTEHFGIFGCMPGAGHGDPGGSAPPGSGSGPSGPPPSPNPDANHDGKVDCWHSVLDSTNPSAYDLSLGQQLGTDFGGANSERDWHTGIDLDCNVGESVNAGYSGTVVASEFDATWGWIVKIQSDDGTVWVSAAHLKDVTVATGEYVMAGELIGHCNASGTSGESGNHLHYEESNYSNTQGDCTASDCYRNPVTEHPCP